MARREALVLLFLLAGAAAAVALHVSVHGARLALSPDSIAYLSAARNLVAGLGLVQYDGEPFLLWPPLFPFLLAGLEAAGLDTLVVAGWIEWAAVAAIATVLGWCVWARTGSASRAAFAAAAALVSKPLWHVAFFLWSEPFFCLFVMAALVLAARVREGGDRAQLAALVFASAAACLTRYTGVLLVAVVALHFLLPDGRRLPVRLRRAVLYAGLSLLPAVAWWIRNSVLTGDWTGGRVGAEPDALSAVRPFADTLANWLVPWSIPFPGKAPIAGVLLIALALAVVRAVRAGGARRETLVSFGLFVAGYGLGILVLGFLTVFNLPDDRILSPLYAPLVGLAFLAWPSASPGRAKLGLVLGFVVLFLWCARSAVVTSRQVETQLHHEHTFASSRWRESDLAAWLAHAARGEPVYSNAPHAIYLYANRICRHVPRRHYFRAPHHPTDDLERFVAEIERSGTALVAWFDVDEGSYLYRPSEYPPPLAIEEVSRFDDGILYRVTARGRAEP